MYLNGIHCTLCRACVARSNVIGLGVQMCRLMWTKKMLSKELGNQFTSKCSGGLKKKIGSSLALPDPLPNRYAGKGSGDLPVSNPFCRNVVLPNNVVWPSGC